MDQLQLIDQFEIWAIATICGSVLAGGWVWLLCSRALRQVRAMGEKLESVEAVLRRINERAGQE